MVKKILFTISIVLLAFIFLNLPYKTIAQEQLNVTKIKSNESTIEMKWDDVADSYKITSSDKELWSGTQTNLILKELQPNTKYNLILKAYNGDTLIDSVVIQTGTLPIKKELPSKKEELYQYQLSQAQLHAVVSSNWV